MAAQTVREQHILEVVNRRFALQNLHDGRNLKSWQNTGIHSRTKLKYQIPYQSENFKTRILKQGAHPKTYNFRLSKRVGSFSKSFGSFSNHILRLFCGSGATLFLASSLINRSKNFSKNIFFLFKCIFLFFIASC